MAELIKNKINGKKELISIIEKNSKNVNKTFSYWLTSELGEKIKNMSVFNNVSESNIVEFCCRKILNLDISFLKIKDIK